MFKLPLVTTTIILYALYNKNKLIVSTKTRPDTVVPSWCLELQLFSCPRLHLAETSYITSHHHDPDWMMTDMRSWQQLRSHRPQTAAAGDYHGLYNQTWLREAGASALAQEPTDCTQPISNVLILFAAIDL